MKNRFSLALATLLIISLSLPVFVFAQRSNSAPNQERDSRSNFPPNVGPSERRGARDRSRSNATGGIEQDFAEALTLVQDNYVDGNKLDYNTVFKSSIIGMLRSLDPHSNYYDAKEFEDLRTDWRSEYFGIGASIGDRRTGDTVDTYILATFDESPAARAGLRFGDRIVEVDGQPMRGKPSSEVRDRIRGPRGSVVKITVERAANGARETVEITREAVPQPTIPDAYMIRPGVAYIDMTRGFNYTTADEFRAALENLRAKGMTSLVLDLRGNPGGLLDQAVKVASHFLQRGQVILSQKGRNGAGNRTYRSDNNSPDGAPVVVLINRNTASASEIVAGALQDHDRGLVIGETSFGKGLVQSITPLEYGTALTLTTSKYYTPSGRSIQRDYTNGSLYDYYTRGGLGSQDEEKEKLQQPARPTGEETRTDSGRVVYGGGGIAPDEAVKPRIFNPQQQRLLDPIFSFVRELVNGRIAGFESYKVQRPINFKHELKASEFPVTDELFKAFKDFVAAKGSFKMTPAQLDKNREYIARQLRYDIVTAAYGTVTATQVLVADDPQLTKAIEVLPRARELAAAAMRGRHPQQKSFE